MHAVVSVCLNTRINLEELQSKTYRAQVLSVPPSPPMKAWVGSAARTAWKSLRSFQAQAGSLGLGTF